MERGDFLIEVFDNFVALEEVAGEEVYLVVFALLYILKGVEFLLQILNHVHVDSLKRLVKFFVFLAEGLHLVVGNAEFLLEVFDLRLQLAVVCLLLLSLLEFVVGSEDFRFFLFHEKFGCSHFL